MGRAGNHDCDHGRETRPDQKEADDDAPFDEKAWRRKYMRLYMKKRRERMKAGKDKLQ